MAADEVLLETSASRGRPLLRFYSWDRLAVSIGYIQSLSAAPAGFAVVRRPTGGGVVYHDHDFTYTVVVPADHWLVQLNRHQSYDRINQAVQSGLADLACPAELSSQDISSAVDRLSMVCFQHPTQYDVLLNGQKIAGSAQRRTVNGLLHQGSIHFGGPLPIAREILSKALQTACQKQLQIKLENFQPDAALLKQIKQREQDKFGTEEWNARR